MSNVDTLNKEIQNLKNQIASLQSQLQHSQNQVNGLLAQCQASEQLITESEKRNMINRTNLILHQQHSKKVDEEMKAIKKENAELKSAAKATPVTPAQAKDTKAA